MFSPDTTVCNTALSMFVLQLPALERLLLWSMRTWAAYYDAPQSAWSRLEGVFAETGIRPALPPFAQLMRALFAGLKGCPDIRCVRCPRIGKDESELLVVLAVAQHESRESINARLRQLMLPAAARSATEAVREIARIFADTGVHLQQGHKNIAVHQPLRARLARTAKH